MSENTMLVRMPGGDVVRRPVAREAYVRDLPGSLIGAEVRLPELRDGEELVQAMGDPIPQIINTR